jgi:hypothetical protein
MFVKSKSVWMLGALALLLMAGCDRTSKAPETAGPDSSPMTISSGEADPNDRAQAGPPFTVTLLPETPRAADELNAVVTGVSGPFTFSWEKNEEPIPGQNKTRLPPAGQVRGDVVRAIVTAGDQEARAEVVIRNSPPKVVSVACKTSLLCRGTDLEVEPRAEDADGDPIEFRYVWRVNDEELFEENGPVLPGDAFRRGDVVKVAVFPRDEESEGEPFDRGMTFEAGNAPPKFVSSPPQTVASLEYRYQVQAVDADEDEISFELTSGPEGMTIDPAGGLVSWAIPEDAAGKHEVKIVARDSEGGTGSQEYALEIKTGD